MCTLPRLPIWLTLVLASVQASAFEVVVKNDSTIAGTPSTVANVFIPGEIPASYLAATCNGDIVAMQVYWASQFGGQPVSTEQKLSLFSAGTFPTPGTVLVNQGGGNAEITGPQLVDGITNEFRFLDPPVNSVPVSVPVTNGQSFVVALELFNQSDQNPFAPSVVYDTDGCQAQTNVVDVSPGTWTDACPLGVTGDWVIRAVVDCDTAGVPALRGPGLGLAVLALVAAGAAANASRLRRGPA